MPPRKHKCCALDPLSVDQKVRWRSTLWSPGSSGHAARAAIVRFLPGHV
jgi:hypothetical protein